MAGLLTQKEWDAFMRSTFDLGEAELATITYLSQHGPTDYEVLRNALYAPHDYTRYHELTVKLIVHRVVYKLGDRVCLVGDERYNIFTPIL